MSEGLPEGREVVKLGTYEAWRDLVLHGDVYFEVPTSSRETAQQGTEGEK